MTEETNETDLVQSHAHNKVHVPAVVVSAPWLGPSTDENDLIQAGDIGHPDTSVEDLQYKTICGIILNIKHGSGTKYKVFERNNYSQFAQNVAAKRQKVLQTAPYDRIMICGDITAAGSGSCFAVVFSTQSESRMMLRYISSDYGVGSLIYIGEPKKREKTLGSSMPIVTPSWPIVPLTMANNEGPSHFCPESAFKAHVNSNESKYFMFHGKAIKVCSFNLLHESVSCSGKFCDRAHSLMAGVACGCMQVGFSRTPVVGEFTIKITVTGSGPQAQNENHIVYDFRSLRTTSLFFRNLQDYSGQDSSVLDQSTKANRAKVNAIVDLINENGGWTVCGWFRKGDVQDASTQEQKVDNDDVTLHISLLVPTQLKYSNRTDATLRDMQISR